ncbi:MAG: endonuclease/exonuclease/phosphatase family protein [Chitinophagaceae bacterium]|nr:endonuclease/exonuclease/phosphatase family protein [Chitinophagaceae bacterium]
MLLICINGNAQDQVKIMSYNIRLDVASDGENRWDARKDKVAGLMNYYEADFIGGQEVQHHQLQYLLTQLTNYSYIGVGRDDGKEAGEYSCIFYNNKKFTVIQQSTFWLSQTPDSVSFGWNAACRRVCTYGLFQNKRTKQMLWVFNTHFDHLGDTARLESAKLITAKINQLTKDKKYPVVLTGDFNSKPGEAPAMYMAAHFQNARNSSKEKPYGPSDTWEGFEFDKRPDGCIDYIFVAKNKNVTVKKFATITDSYDMKYPSDHFPILTTLEINK